MSTGLAGFPEMLDVLNRLRALVADARQMEGISLRDLTQACGVSINSLSRFERGGDIQLSSALALLAWLSRTTQAEGEVCQ